MLENFKNFRNRNNDISSEIESESTFGKNSKIYDFKDKSESIETMLIGIISKNMGTVNQGLCINAGKEVFEYIKKMSIEDFNNIKNLG